MLGVLLLVTMGCGGDDEGSAPTTTRRDATAADPECEVATEGSIETIGEILDRVETDPDGAAAAEAEIGATFGELGQTFREACPGDAEGDALSEIVIFVDREASSRAGAASGYAEGMLVALCDDEDEDHPVDLTDQGQAVCDER